MCGNHCHEHSHSHGCGHSHSHDHSHGGGKTQSPEENLALLAYMSDHNHQHAEDLHELLHALEADGKQEAAALVSEALNLYRQGNEKLVKALSCLKGE